MGSEGCSQLESSELSHRSLHRLRSCQQLYRLDQPEDGWRWYVFREKTSAAKYLNFLALVVSAFWDTRKFVV